MDIYIVGNAPTSDLSARIDDADRVIRFNLVPNFGKTTGTKTTTLAVVNTGVPGSELLNPKNMRRNPAFALAGEILLPVTPDDAKERLEKSPKLKGELTEFSHLTADPLYAGKIIRFVDKAAKDALLAKLDSTMPSTGATVLEEVMATRQPNDRVFLVGFKHTGWSGHPWEKEKALTEEYIRQGLLIRLD